VSLMQTMRVLRVDASGVDIFNGAGSAFQP
jgi:hypothetical protein